MHLGIPALEFYVAPYRLNDALTLPENFTARLTFHLFFSRFSYAVVYHIPFDSADTIFCFGAVLAVLADSACGFVIVLAFSAVPGLPLHPKGRVSNFCLEIRL